MILNFKQFINEALGVPEGGDENGEIIYNRFIQSFKKEFKKSFLIDNILEMDGKVKFDYYFSINIHIGELKIDKCEIFVNIKDSNKKDCIELQSLGVYNRAEYIESIDKVKHHTDLPVQININFLCDKESYTDDLISYIEKDVVKNEIISALSHELMHVYNHYKHAILSVDKFAVDNTYTELSSGSYFNILCVRKLFYNLYYISNPETPTRNPEVSSLLRSNKVTKKNFEKFLSNTRVYKNLMEIKNFSFSKFKDELRNSEKEIDQYFKFNNELDNIKLPIDKKIDIVLKDIRKIIEGTSLLELKKILVQSVEDLNELPDNKLQKIKELMNKQEYKKNDINYYFGKLENMLNKKAEYSIRKISKLFDKVE